MAQYVVNNKSQTGGEHEVHKEGCTYFPSDFIRLGDHSSCHTAVTKAKQHYNNVDGCYWCSRACHTR